MAHLKTGARNVLLIGPRNVRNVPVFDAESIKSFGGRPPEEGGVRGLVKKHVQELLLFFG
jgi:hypothetical protein